MLVYTEILKMEGLSRMTTKNLKLPLITDNMANDVVRDMNALAEATDGALKELGDSKANDTDLEKLQAQVTTHLDEAVTKTKSDLTFYVSTTGNDANDGLTSDTAFKTIAKAINLIPQIVNHNVTVNVAAGTYNESIEIKGFVGIGTIIILGSTGLADTHTVNNFVINRVHVPVIIRGFRCILTSGHAILASYSKFIGPQYLKCINQSTYDGIHFLSTNGRVFGCEISNKNAGIYTQHASTVTSDSNTGVNNTFGLAAYSSSKIGKQNNQPSGISAEIINSGGEIR